MNNQEQSKNIVHVDSNAPLSLSSGLLQRGLSDLENKHTSIEQIHAARKVVCFLLV